MGRREGRMREKERGGREDGGRMREKEEGEGGEEGGRMGRRREGRGRGEKGEREHIIIVMLSSTFDFNDCGSCPHNYFLCSFVVR